ncbi:MAG: DUF7344 domain-containing protein [Halobacteriota archaeon]
MFELLGNPRRRRLLNLLAASKGPFELSELARLLAVAEGGGTADERTYWRVYVSLYQTHVPKLERLGVVSYSNDEERVVPGRQIDELIYLLEGRKPVTWSKAYLALAITVTALFVYYLLVLYPAESFATAVAVMAPLLLGGLSLVRATVTHGVGTARTRESTLG